VAKAAAHAAELRPGTACIADLRGGTPFLGRIKGLGLPCYAPIILIPGYFRDGHVRFP